MKTILDIPTGHDGKVDIDHLSQILGLKPHNIYLCCCVIQKHFVGKFHWALEASHLPHLALTMQVKNLLQDSTNTMLTLSNWCQELTILPYDTTKSQLIFTRILKNYKINKFHEINFKILAQILVTPKMLSSIKGEDNLQ